MDGFFYCLEAILNKIAGVTLMEDSCVCMTGLQGIEHFIHEVLGNCFFWCFRAFLFLFL